MDLNLLLFDGFQSLDLFGPLDVLARIPGCVPRSFSLRGGPVKNNAGMQVLTEPSSAVEPGGVLLIPGGMGTRPLSTDAPFLAEVKRLAESSEWCLSVCTGSVLLAASGALDDRRATSNKYSFSWVERFKGPVWQRSARWVVNGKFYTASGVAAGIDMAFGFVEDRFGKETAESFARRMEYVRNPDPENDPFRV